MRADAGGFANRAARLPPSGGALGNESTASAPKAQPADKISESERFIRRMLAFPLPARQWEFSERDLPDGPVNEQDKNIRCA